MKTYIKITFHDNEVVEYELAQDFVVFDLTGFMIVNNDNNKVFINPRYIVTYTISKH